MAAVTGVGGSGRLAQLQRQLTEDLQRLEQDVAARADETVVQGDSLRVQMDQMQIAQLLQEQQREALGRVQDRPAGPSPQRPDDGSWYL